MSRTIKSSVIAFCLIFIGPIIGHAQNVSSSQSPEAQVFMEYFNAFSDKEMKIFCDAMTIPTNRQGEVLPNIQHNLDYYKFLVQNKYATEAPFKQLNESGVWIRTFVPTDELWALASRREGNCFYAIFNVPQNIKIVKEEKHDRHKEITVIYATFESDQSGYQRLNALGRGNKLSFSKERRGRYLMMIDPFTSKYRIVTFDAGDANGEWSGRRLLDALEKVNTLGPQSIADMKPFN